MSATNENIAELWATLDEYGFVVVEDLLNTEVVQRLAVAIGQAFDGRVPADEPNQHGLLAPEQCLVLTFSWLLHDVTRSNGSRVFMPFSHHSRRGPRPHANYDHLAHVEAPAGSVILFKSAVWHAVKKNVTADEERIEFTSAYVVPWIDQRGVGWQATPNSVLQQMSPRMRELSRGVMEP